MKSRSERVRLPWYKAFPRAFFEATVGMELLEKGAYRLILDLIYMYGGPLPDDPQWISGHLGCSVRMWNRLKKRLVDKGKLQIVDNMIFNETADKLLINAAKYQDKQRENRFGGNKNSNLQKPASDHIRRKEERKSLSKEKGDGQTSDQPAVTEAIRAAARGTT